MLRKVSMLQRKFSAENQQTIYFGASEGRAAASRRLAAARKKREVNFIEEDNYGIQSKGE